MDPEASVQLSRLIATLLVNARVAERQCLNMTPHPSSHPLYYPGRNFYPSSRAPLHFALFGTSHIVRRATADSYIKKKERRDNGFLSHRLPRGRRRQASRRPGRRTTILEVPVSQTHTHTRMRMLCTACVQGWRKDLLGCMQVLNPAQCESQCTAVRSVNPPHTSAQTVSGSAQLRSIYSLADVRRGVGEHRCLTPKHELWMQKKATTRIRAEQR